MVSARVVDASGGLAPRRARGRTVLATLLVVVAALAPSVLAQSGDAPVSVTSSVHVPMPWDDAFVATDETTGTTDRCRSDYVIIDSDSLTFQDRAEFTDCAEVRVPLEMPSGATGFTVYFTADRDIQSGAASESASLPPDARQTIQVLEPGITPAPSINYFDSGDYGRPPQAFAYEFQVGNEPTVAFYFSDDSSQTEEGRLLGSNHAFGAHVTNAEVVFHGIAKEHETTNLGTRGGDTAAIVRSVTLTQLPSEDIVIGLPRGTEVESVLANGRPVTTAEVTEEISNTGTEVTIARSETTRELEITYASETDSVHSPAVSILGAVLILAFIPMAILSFIPITKSRFGTQEEAEE